MLSSPSPRAESGPTPKPASHGPLLHVEVERSADRVTVRVRGEVDGLTAPRLAQAIEPRFDGATPVPVVPLVLDLRGVTFFDSAAIHALVRLNERYPGALEVLPSAQVFRVLDISGLSGQPWVRPAP